MRVFSLCVPVILALAALLLTPMPLPLPGCMEPMRDEGTRTQLLVPSGSVSFSYASVSWRLFLRKEVGTRAGPQPDLSLGCGEGSRLWEDPASAPSLCSPHTNTTHLLRPGFPSDLGDRGGAGGAGWCTMSPLTLPCPLPGLLPPRDLQPSLQPQAPL